VRSLRFTLALILALLAASWSVQAQSVQLWTQDATQPWLLEAIDAFTAETGIEVEVKAISFGTEELFTAFAGDSPPDLFTHGLAALGAFAALGVLEPLESIYTKWEFAADIVPQGLAAGQYQGRQVALPLGGVVVRDLVYRSDLFELAGIGADQPPRNWSDLVEYGRKLTERRPDGTLARSGLAVDTGDQMFSMLLRHLGRDLIEDGRSTLASAEAVEALSFQTDLIHVYGVHELGFNANLPAGTAAMTWTDMRYWSLDDPVVDFLKVATFPYEKEPATFLGTRIVMMPSGAKNKDEAIRLLEFLLHPRTQYRLTMLSGSIPFFGQAREWEWVQDSPVLVHFMAALSYAYPNPAHELWFDIRTIIQEAIASAMRQERPPRNALEDAHARVQALLEN